MNFYKNKTYKRLNGILDKYDGIDNFKINNANIISIKNLLKKINWNKISEGNSYFIHGDLQFDNILYRGGKNFLLLDWRHSFGDYIGKGDIYYDIAKLLGGILINYKKIKLNKFNYEEKKNNINYKILENRNILKDSFCTLYNFIVKKKLNLDKIYILTALIFLNMSPLHHRPFDKILFGLSKEILSNKNYFKKYEPN
jgi:thiamine kinase-like enzyme